MKNELFGCIKMSHGYEVQQSVLNGCLSSCRIIVVLFYPFKETRRRYHSRRPTAKKYNMRIKGKESLNKKVGIKPNPFNLC